MLVDKGCTRVCCCLFCGGRSWGLQLCLHFSGGTAAAAVSIAVEVCKQRRGTAGSRCVHFWLSWSPSKHMLLGRGDEEKLGKKWCAFCRRLLPPPIFRFVLFFATKSGLFLQICLLLLPLISFLSLYSLVD